MSKAILQNLRSEFFICLFDIFISLRTISIIIVFRTIRLNLSTFSSVGHLRRRDLSAFFRAIIMPNRIVDNLPDAVLKFSNFCFWRFTSQRFFDPVVAERNYLFAETWFWNGWRFCGFFLLRIFLLFLSWNMNFVTKSTLINST